MNLGKCRSGGTEASVPPRADGSRSSCGLSTDVQHRDRCPSHVRPNSRKTSIAHTRQVTVTRIICGVDIASRSLEARIGQQGAAGSFPNTPEGIAALEAFCQAHRVELLAMEATGGYEQQAFAQLSEQGLPVAILNPRAVRQFAQSMGSLEKTDRIDAGMIAWYAEVKKSRPASLAPESQQHLRALVTRLRQLTDIRTAQLNQQRLVTDRAVQASFKKLLAVLARQIRELEQRIAALLEKDPLWRQLNEAFKNTLQIEHRASSSRSKHEGESSYGLCDRLSRTRDNSQRQLPTDQDYAVSTQEYQTDQSSLKTAPTAARSVLEQRRKQRQQKTPDCSG